MDKKRAALLVIFVTIFIDLLGFGIIIPILPIYAKDLGASDFMVGVIAAVYSLFNFLFAPFWGTLSDRYGRRPVILISVVITAVSYLVFAHAVTILLLIVSRMFSGLGSANISAAQAYITDVSDSRNRAKNLGLIGAAFGLGFIFGPPIGGLLKANFGIESVGYFAAGLCAINLVLAFFMLPETLKEKNTDAGFHFRPITELVRAMHRLEIRKLFTINFVFVTAFSLMTVTAALLWSERYDLTEDQVGYVFAFVGVTTALVQGFLVGPLSKKFGERRLLIYASILMAFGLLSMPFVPKDLFWLEFISLAAISLANGGLTPSITSLISRFAGRGEQGKMLGLNQSSGSLSRVAGPIVGGSLYGIHYFWPYVGSFVLMLLVLVIATRVPVPKND